MNRKEKIWLLLTFLAIAVSGGTSMLPEVIKQQFPWWQLLYGISSVTLLAIIGIAIPSKTWKRILNLFPIRLIKILYTQRTNPSQFLYIQSPEFKFLSKSGRRNSRRWNCKFNIVSCLFSDLKIDRLDVHVTYPICETTSITNNRPIVHMSALPIEVTEANMSDTSFHNLYEMTNPRETQLEIRYEVLGFRNGRKKFTIRDDECKALLSERGTTNET